MRYKSRSPYPCFLPENYREQLKRYQADLERSVEGSEAGVGSDDQRESNNGEEQETKDWDVPPLSGD
jgi:hypothetical protein